MSDNRHAQNMARYARQLWARRRELGSMELWKKVARIGVSVAQSELWPQSLLEAELGVFEDRPFNLHLEPTNACNANCVFCPHQHMERQKTILDMEVFQKALADYVAIGGGDLQLEVVVGEPLLDPTFLDKVRLARAEPSIDSIGTISNALALDRVGIDAFLTSGITKVLVSTAGFDRESYVELYRTEKYDEMRDNVLQLLRRNEELGRPVEVTIGFRTNRSLKQVMADADFAAIEAHHPQIDFTFAFCDWPGRIDIGGLPRGFVRREVPAKREGCSWLYDGPMVYASGDVGLCGCQDLEATSELMIGNIMESSLLELWHSARVKKIRKDFVTNPPAICKQCCYYRNLDHLRTVAGLHRAWLTRQRTRSARWHGAIMRTQARDEVHQTKL